MSCTTSAESVLDKKVVLKLVLPLQIIQIIANHAIGSNQTQRVLLKRRKLVLKLDWDVAVVKSPFVLIAGKRMIMV